jgi:hypothetical protein
MGALILTLGWISLLGTASVAHTWHVPADVVEVACGTYCEHDVAMPATSPCAARPAIPPA